MTAAEFVTELAKSRTLFEWNLIPDLNWTPERRIRPRYHIRAMSKDLKPGFLFDPIGALCYARTGLAHTVDSWPRASAALGLSESDAWQIVAASNDLTWRQIGALRGPHPQIRALRTRLAAVVELELAAIADQSSSFVWL
jgi:hypothetical protein